MSVAESGTYVVTHGGTKQQSARLHIALIHDPHPEIELLRVHSCHYH